MLNLLIRNVFFVALLALPAAAPAMVPLEDDDLAGFTGEGIAFALTDIAVKLDPTGYIELTGANVTGSPLKYLRGDLRWYGLSYTSADNANGQTWSGVCTSGYLGLGCPIGGTIDYLAPHDNPLVFRSFDYSGTLFDGTLNQTRTVLELVFPTSHDPYRFGFWGEMNVGTSTSGATATSALGDGSKKLQVQNVWNNVDQAGTVVRLFQHSNTADPTMGLQYLNYFAADIRMSVNQTFFSPDTLGQTPEFDDTEGLYIGDYRVYFPMGQLHYQSTILDDEEGTKNGDFSIITTQIPDLSAIYHDHYGRTFTDDPTGGYDRTKYNTRGTYDLTHGYLRIGDYAPTINYSVRNIVPAFGSVNAPITGAIGQEVAGCIADRPGCTRNGAADTDDGFFFVAAPGETFRVFQLSPNSQYDGNVDADVNDNNIINGVSVSVDLGTMVDLSVINLGDGRIEGINVHYLRITSLGAGP